MHSGIQFDVEYTNQMGKQSTILNYITFIENFEKILTQRIENYVRFAFFFFVFFY